MLRVVDANLDRVSEGLRVLEDVGRFLLADSNITSRLSALRHGLIVDDPELRTKLLAARDVAGDVARQRGGHARGDIAALVTANAKRAQEALRVLEECASLPDMPEAIRRVNFEQARFILYEIERELTLKLQRRDKRRRIAGLYVIIDSQTLRGRSEADLARQAVAGGARVIQLRDKHRGKRELLPIARELRQVCYEAGVLFIINDHVDLARVVDADGVHLGRTDLPADLARQILAGDRIVGCSARTVAAAIAAQEEGCDYLGVGAVYPSPTKPTAEVIGLLRLKEVKSAVSVPVVALGGIGEGTIGEVLETGVEAVAVISAVAAAEDAKEAVGRLVAAMREHT